MPFLPRLAAWLEQHGFRKPRPEGRPDAIKKVRAARAELEAEVKRTDEQADKTITELKEKKGDPG